MKCSPALVQWLLGILLSIILGLTVVVWQTNTARMDRQDVALALIDARLISIQEQYVKIDVIDERVKNLKEILDRLIER